MARKLPAFGLLVPLLVAVLVIGACTPADVDEFIGTPTPAATATPTVTPLVTPTPTPTTGIVVTPPPTGAISRACVRVVHQALGEFISYLEWLLGWTGIGVDYFELTVRETNNSKPVRLEFDPAQGGWVGQAGLTGTGDKTIVSLIAHLTDGSTIDLTDELIAALGDDVLTVRFPEEDTFGNCP